METLNSSPKTTPAPPEQAVVSSSTPNAEPKEKGLLARLSVNDWLLLGGLVALFFPMFRGMVDLWTIPEAPQAYGLLILPASLLLAWMLRGRVSHLAPQPSLWGVPVVLLGILALLVGTLAAALTASAIGFILVVTGIVWMRYGGAIARRFWFPLAFLLAMVPFPSEVLHRMTFPLQRLSIHGAALLLKPFHEVSVEGSQLHVGSFTLDVIAPCSGLTIVLPLVILSIYYLSLIQAPLWKKAVLVALTFPVAMGINAVRVALIGIVGEAWGGHAAGAFHDYSGLITVALGFVALFFLAREMKCDQLSEELAL